jgi:import receptor subunit TOM70
LKYTDAIKTLERGDETNVALAAYYSNRAASYTALHQWENVERDSSAALKIKPDYLKTLVRRAQAYEQLDKPDKALDGSSS